MSCPLARLSRCNCTRSPETGKDWRLFSCRRLALGAGRWPPAASRLPPAACRLLPALLLAGTDLVARIGRAHPTRHHQADWARAPARPTSSSLEPRARPGRSSKKAQQSSLSRGKFRFGFEFKGQRKRTGAGRRTQEARAPGSSLFGLTLALKRRLLPATSLAS